MKTSDFNFDLPEELIAQTPIEKRDHSRLLVVERNNGELSHEHFYDITKHLRAGDCLVINNSRVLPARLYGVKDAGGANVEVLLLNNIENDDWECIVHPGRRLKKGAEVTFGGGILKGVISDVLENGNRIITFKYDGIFLEILEEIGTMPLPPYITERLEDKERYQTVYSKTNGSAAAPTAGLHFTPELLEQIEAMGVEVVNVTLHVGLGTFRPVKVESVTEHHMHSETFYVPEDSANRINNVKTNGGRVIAVGTTSCRTLESVTDEHGIVHAGQGDTSIFIYPGYKFKAIDGLITNFHLPESTLIMLVSAFSSREITLEAYKEAVKERYRFFSFGDAMLLI